MRRTTLLVTAMVVAGTAVRFKLDYSTPNAISRGVLLVPAILVFLGLVIIAKPAQAAPGDLDTSFGTDGKVTTSASGSDYGRAVAIQQDGKIVAAGDSNQDFALARYNTDGSLDSTFGSDGKVLTDFGESSDSIHAVAIQPDGKIVTAGFAGIDPYDFALARYNSDGTLDPTFDTDGKVTTDFGSSDRANGVAIQPDGKIVAAGDSNQDFALARYNTEGSLDPTFDTDGKLTTDFGGADVAHGVAIQDDGKIVAAGSGSYGGGSDDDFTLGRYISDGTLDPTFDTDGKVTTDFGSSDRANGVAIQQDGKIVAAGDSNQDFALARYNTEGSLDPTFDTDGKLTTDFGGADVAHGVAIQDDGKIVAAGSYGGDPNQDFALARYNTAGSLDPTFSTDGKLTTDFGGADVAYGVAIQDDGKIVVGGTSNNRFSLARFYGSSSTAPQDATKPSVTLATPTEGAVYKLRASVNASYSCLDEEGGSGLQSCKGDVDNGSPIDTSTAGTKTFTVTATDEAGNTYTVTHTYNVTKSGKPTSGGGGGGKGGGPKPK